MNVKNIDFGYLIEQLYMPVGQTYTQVIDKYKDSPMCLMECIDNGKCSEHIRVDFNGHDTPVTYFFNENKEVTLTCLCLPEPSHVDSFIALLLKYAAYYDYIKKYWVIKMRYFVTVEQEDSCTHFICCKIIG